MDINQVEELIVKAIDNAYEQLDDYKLKSIKVSIDTDRLNNNIKNNKKLDMIKSKIGGYFYIPKNVGNIPKNSDGEALMLLAQINISELPKNIFPLERGIIQIFVDFVDDSYGLDFDDNTCGSGHKVLYYEDILGEEDYLSEQEIYELFKQEYLDDDDLENLLDDNDDNKEIDFYKHWDCCPINMGELPLIFRAKTNNLSPYDDIVEELFIEQWNKLCPDMQISSNYYNELPKEISNMFFDVFDKYPDNSGHKIMGYPCFVQSDPREYMENGKDYNILLFQLDSELCTWHKQEQKYDICWGDAGIANFFIKESDLVNKDFSKVLYNWDCS